MKNAFFILLIGFAVSGCMRATTNGNGTSPNSSLATTTNNFQTTAGNENSRRGELGGGIREASDYGTSAD